MGGPEFIIKMIPVSRLTLDFQYNQVQSIISQLQQCEVSVIAIICDGNQVNRTFFKQFDTDPKKPWLSNQNMFLLFDYVHLIKRVGNNWLSEQ